MENNTAKTRLQIFVSPEMLNKIDDYCSKMGVSRSAFCCMMIAQGTMAYDTAIYEASRLIDEKIKKGEMF